MNSLKINKIIVLIIFIGLINSVATYTISTAQTSQDITLTQSEPNIVISSLSMNSNIPEEGDEIIATIIIENEDNIVYSNLLIQLTLIPESSGHDNEAGDDILAGKVIIQQLVGLGSNTIEMSFTAPAGQYVAVAVVIYNNLPIQSSQNSVTIQILSPKVGDNFTLIFAISILALFFVLILFAQATYDAIKLKNINLELNGNE